MTTLTAERISVAYEGRAVIEELSLHLPDGRVTAVIGANGCGKSTLLRTLARLLPTTSGRVLVDATDAASFRPREFARRVGLLRILRRRDQRLSRMSLTGKENENEKMDRTFAGRDDAPEPLRLRRG